ncbi:MAG TPA: TIGR01777 family oxidoreductase [Bryobacteraceae bacterium]|nr:TIGR01777 family oxidoreductase [Bryobacteraceae bacterium]
MRIAITGASGFIGRRLVSKLKVEGNEVQLVSLRTAPREQDLAGCGAVIHLAGEPVAQRWTSAARERIRASRVDATRSLVAALQKSPPATLISASAVGYYGPRGDEILTEKASPASDFLGQIAVDWEREAQKAEAFGVRVVTLRIAMVLGRDGGALKKMLPPFRLGLGGRIGTGKQWISWIHLEDLISMIEFALRTPISGPLNASAPNPVINAEFTRELARAVHRPAILPVPLFLLKLLFGQMAEILYASNRVIPEAALNAGFPFRFPEISGAFQDLL